MAKKFEKKLLSSAMAVALAAGLGYAGSASAIHVADNGKGQLLMAPLYLADFGYNSKVAIVNTSDTEAVKVRVAFRSKTYSDEFDFLCLMTPSDVCRFEIVRAVNPVTGKDEAYLTSTDDSILADEIRPIFASQCGTESGQYCKDGRLWVQVFDWDIRVTVNNVPLDMNEIGHMEVLGAWAASGTIAHPAASDNSYPAGAIVIREGMSKHELYRIMGPKMARSILAGHSTAQDETLSYATGRMVDGVCTATPGVRDATGVSNSDVTGDFYGAPCNAGANVFPSSRIRSTDPSWIQLTGQIEMSNGHDRMGMALTALAGDVWDNLTPVTHNPPYGMFSYSASADADGDAVNESYAFDGRVISYPSYDVFFASEVRTGVAFGGSRAGLGAVSVYDNIVEIENALATLELQGSYENAFGNLTNVVVTFPTKYRHDSSDNIYREDHYDQTGVVAPKGPESLGDLDDSRDVCASNLSVPGSHVTGDVRLYDGRVFYPPFRAEGSIQYGLTVWNDQEVRDTTMTAFPIFSPGKGPGPVTTITEEVNYMWMTWPTKAGFGTGWFSLNLVAAPGCQYKGAPVLAYAHKTQVKDGIFANSWLMPLAREKDTDETIK